jgi:hypothetical protein
MVDVCSARVWWGVLLGKGLMVCLAVDGLRFSRWAGFNFSCSVLGR